MSYQEASRATGATREQLIAERFQKLRDAVYGLKNDWLHPAQREALLKDGNSAVGGLGLVRVSSGEYETFSRDEEWVPRSDYGIGVVEGLSEESGKAYLYFERDGRRLRAPVSQIAAIAREVSTDPALRDENGSH